MSRTPLTVVLATREWTPACRQVAEQLHAEDTLVVVADHESDPVVDAVRDGTWRSDAGGDAEAETLAGTVRVVCAGDPDRCSGKANAVATGMAAAETERLVWTDDDFHHPPAWLATLRREYERFGPVTELPFFVGRDPLATLLEPAYALGGTLGTYAGRKAWAGGVIFERGDLEAPDAHRERFGDETGTVSDATGATSDATGATSDATETTPDTTRTTPDATGTISDETVFRRALRRTVTDDGLLSMYLDTTPRRRVRSVPAGGSIRATLERHVRFAKIVARTEPAGFWGGTVLSTVVACACLLAPLPATLVVTLLAWVVYAWLGVERPSWLLAVPATLAGPPLFAYAAARRTFVWGDRRYAWPDPFSVEIRE
ncbi:glycosyltransferase [Halobaculum sp. MBLA0147]|uniref:glycosyltransferase n=1 Tax=Halobaculum sp. MBLA0147 TaxID=3079934 RepID=UPI003524A941